MRGRRKETACNLTFTDYSRNARPYPHKVLHW
nr:MAG TPA: hypothetical protein [Caudoviricetes sp.]